MNTELVDPDAICIARLRPPRGWCASCSYQTNVHNASQHISERVSIKNFLTFLDIYLRLTPMVATVQKPAPEFKAPAVVEGQFRDISLSDYKGKWYVPPIFTSIMAYAAYEG